MTTDGAGRDDTGDDADMSSVPGLYAAGGSSACSNAWPWSGPGRRVAGGGIAVVLAVKGLARYPEIRDQHAGEQFIIGTFASVLLWAVAAAGVARLTLT